MLQVARLAPNLLHESAERVLQFLRDQFNDDGGGKDRAGGSDLYYTVFALEGLIALQADLPEQAVRSYLTSFGDGEALDFVHLTCLARCWSALGNDSLVDGHRCGILERIESYRCTDGGYSTKPQQENGTAYHSFLAYGAYQDLRKPIPSPERITTCLAGLRTGDGAYANDQSMRLGTTPTTAAAITMLRQLNAEVPKDAGEWLLARCRADGGFEAIPGAPMPDLLSTATALHALSGAHVSFEHRKEDILDFIDTLWTGSGFCGSWADDAVDSEYTYYALLALGHLSL